MLRAAVSAGSVAVGPVLSVYFGEAEIGSEISWTAAFARGVPLNYGILEVCRRARVP